MRFAAIVAVGLLVAGCDPTTGQSDAGLNQVDAGTSNSSSVGSCMTAHNGIRDTCEEYQNVPEAMIATSRDDFRTRCTGGASVWAATPCDADFTGTCTFTANGIDLLVRIYKASEVTDFARTCPESWGTWTSP